MTRSLEQRLSDALAGSELVTTDRDFARFEDLDWRTPPV